MSLYDPSGKCREKPGSSLLVEKSGIIGVLNHSQKVTDQLLADCYDLVLASWQWSNSRRQSLPTPDDIVDSVVGRTDADVADEYILQNVAAQAAADVAADVWRDIAFSMETGPHKELLQERFLGVVPWYRVLPSFAFMLIFLLLLVADVMIYRYDGTLTPLNYTEQLILPCLERYRCAPNMLVDDVVAALQQRSNVTGTAISNVSNSTGGCPVRVVHLAFWNQTTSRKAAARFPLTPAAGLVEAAYVVMHTITSAGVVDATSFTSASTPGIGFSYEPALIQFVSNVTFRRSKASQQTPVQLAIGSQVNFVWKYSSEVCPRSVSWPPTFMHSVAILPAWGELVLWTTMTYSMIGLTLIIFAASLIARRSFEFKYDLKVPTDAEKTRDRSFYVFQGFVLFGLAAITTFALYITKYDANDWGPFAHLRRFRILLRLGKILCAIPGLYFVRHLPTRRLFLGVNVTSGLGVLFYFIGVSFAASFATSDPTLDLRTANSALSVSIGSLFEILGRQVTDSGIIEPIALLVSLGIVGVMSKPLDVYTRQYYWNQWHSQKEYFARHQTVISGSVLDADKNSWFYRWFHKVPVVQSALLDYFAAFLMIVIYTVITFVLMYPLHQSVRDTQEGVSFANVLV